MFSVLKVGRKSNLHSLLKIREHSKLWLPLLIRERLLKVQGNSSQPRAILNLVITPPWGHSGRYFRLSHLGRGVAGRSGMQLGILQYSYHNGYRSEPASRLLTATRIRHRRNPLLRANQLHSYSLCTSCCLSFPICHGKSA